MTADHSLRTPLLETDTADLVLAARHGSADAARVLLHRYQPLLACTVRRYFLLTQTPLEPSVEMEDLWQEVRYAFLLSVRRYDPARGIPFGGYVKVVLPWQVRRLWRQSTPHIDLCLDDIGAEAVDATDDDFVTAIVVRDLVARLSCRHAHVLTQIYFHDRPVADIAREWGLTTRAVERLHRRAEAALHALFTDGPGHAHGPFP